MECSAEESIKSDSEDNVSFICRPIFHVCSDLPNLSRIGIFSCDKCDRWRNQVLNHRQHSIGRDEMAYYKCTRQKRRSKGITIKVSFKNCPAIADHVME